MTSIKWNSSLEGEKKTRFFGETINCEKLDTPFTPLVNHAELRPLNYPLDDFHPLKQEEGKKKCIHYSELLRSAIDPIHFPFNVDNVIDAILILIRLVTSDEALVNFTRVFCLADFLFSAPLPSPSFTSLNREKDSTEITGAAVAVATILRESKVGDECMLEWNDVRAG